MSKDVSQYLNYYIGQQVRYRFKHWEAGIWSDWMELRPWRLSQLKGTDKYGIQLVLRKLKDITEDEAKGFLAVLYNDAVYWKHDEYGVYWRGPGITGAHLPFYPLHPAGFHYLLQQGFDLWFLIDSGAAIDAKNLQTQQQ